MGNQKAIVNKYINKKLDLNLAISFLLDIDKKSKNKKGKIFK